MRYLKDRLVYAGLRAGSRLPRWIRRRFTPLGRGLLAGLVATAAWGVDTNTSMAYQAFTLVLALLGLSLTAGLRGRPRVGLRRRLPRFGTAGLALPYRIEVENLGGGALRGLVVQDELPDPRPSFAEFHSAADPKDGAYPWLDRFLGYSRWRRLVSSRGKGQVEAAVPDLPAGGRATVAASLIPAARGRLDLAAITVARTDPLGLVRSLSGAPERESVLILPKRYPVPRLDLPGTRRYQLGGVALASAVGDSQEFVGMRDYRPGDPLRRIHWRSWAKAGRPIVKENQDEYFVRHALALDTFGAPGAAFEEAVSVAASFACAALTQESLLDLLFVGAEAYCVTAGRGLGGADRLLEVLASVAPCPDKGFAELESGVARRRGSLSGCICVLLAWDEGRRALVRRLRASGVPVRAVVVRAPGAPALGPQDGPVHALEAGRIAEGLASLA